MNVVSAVLNGFSQIFFIESNILGVVTIIGLAITTPLGLLLALIGNLASLTTAILLKLDKNLIVGGFYGFSGTLIGLALAIFLKSFSLEFIFTVIGSAASTIIFFLLLKTGLPPIGAPYVLAVWSVILLLKYLKLN